MVTGTWTERIYMQKPDSTSYSHDNESNEEFRN